MDPAPPSSSSPEQQHQQHRLSNGGGAGGLSYSKLFNLEPLMGVQIPVMEDSNHYERSSPTRSSSSQEMSGRSNGFGDASSSLNRKRDRRSYEVDNGVTEDDDDEVDYRVTEEDYFSMLTEHLQKYKRLKVKAPSRGASSSHASTSSSKKKKISKASRSGYDDKEASVVREEDVFPEYYGLEFDADCISVLRLHSLMESPYLDIGEGIMYQIPPTYEDLTSSLKLPTLSEIRLEESVLKRPLDFRSLAALISSNEQIGAWNGHPFGEFLSQYESLQARVRVEGFTLQVHDGLFAIPEGSAGRIRRAILTESGSLEIFYVKVLEKGDTYEIIERSLPKKLVKDAATIEREQTENMGKIWTAIAKSMPKHQRVFMNLHRKQFGEVKRLAENCQREVKLKVERSIRLMKGAAVRTRRLARDMVIFWKRVDKEQAELKKKEERDAAEALKREEEIREARRQQQRLNFLLSQTELYSHFMQDKSSLQPSEVGERELGRPEDGSIVGDTEPQDQEDSEEADMKREAMRAAQHAVSRQKMITQAFDIESTKFRQTGDFSGQANDGIPVGSIDMDLLNPSTMPVKSSVLTPEMFKGVLREYQLKGLQWLVNCYEQGLNGILADEMGLGKTIQAMAFLAHLAEEKNIWGPFLVVAPTSVLNNWADEISRFCPDLKTLPYWGGIAERTILRKNINPKRLYRRDSAFHVLITSYTLLVTDEKYLKRVKWQYMVLDEAQAIKNSSSMRWNTLRTFHCRNRLLLTGTPIQNKMAELWALLHFIMPTLFDSHEQFNEWFSKGIESHAEHGGTLNEHQLNRLHQVLKPFMLRRLKKDVVSEITVKTEVTVHCKLSSRQLAFYQAIKNKISLADLLVANQGHLNSRNISNLMNIVMQLRKVCCHPELFERNEGKSSFYFSDIPNSLLAPPFGEMEDVYYAGQRNPVSYKMPKLVYRDIQRYNFQQFYSKKLLNIFTPYNIYLSALPQHEPTCMSGTFGFTRLMDLSPSEASFLASSSLLEKLSFSVIRWDRKHVDEMLDVFQNSENDYSNCDHIDSGKFRAIARMLLLPSKSDCSFLYTKVSAGSDEDPFEALALSHQDRFRSNIRLLHATYAFIPAARAPPVHFLCSDRNHAYQTIEELHHPWTKKLFLGFARTSELNGPWKPRILNPLIEVQDSHLPIPEPVLELPYRIFGSSPPMSNFDPAKMLTDSGKLHTLDLLLRRLRMENHRVLLFAQMTKMLDILEDYVNFRKYKYLRLDGSSAIVDRHDMVRNFQQRNDVFIFLLSTRAGGVGINLTAADTVIFYEIDWNPTNDMQAMDRAHRLGQKKDVTVYRLICKDTVEEKILQRANNKSAMQHLVMTGQHCDGDLVKQEDVVSLLIDDTQLEQKLKEISTQAKDRQQKKKQSMQKSIKFDEEGNWILEDFKPDGGEQDNAAKKKKKPSTQKKPPQKHDQGAADPLTQEDDHTTATASHRPKRVKRPPTNNVHESNIDREPT